MVNDADRLARWLAEGTLLAPGPDAPGTVHLARAVARIGGVPGFEDDPLSGRIADAIGEAEHHVVVLVDGLGLGLLRALPETAWLRRRLAMELRAVFPSTTAAALTSLATGLWPGEHGVPAWWTYLPEAAVTAVMLPFIERGSGRPLGEFGVTAEDTYPRPSLFGRVTRDVRSRYPRGIADSVYSRYFRGGTVADPYDDPGDAMAAAAARIRGTSMPSLTYIYVPIVDDMQHRHGSRSAEAMAALTVTDEALSRLSAEVGGRAKIVVSADHGFMEEPPVRHNLAPDDELLDLLDGPPHGEPRVPMFRPRPGQAERFAERFRARFGDRFALVTVDQAEELRLFGPGPILEPTRGRIGEFIAIAPGPDVLLYDGQASLEGYHAGLSPAEMRIPLVIA